MHLELHTSGASMLVCMLACFPVAWWLKVAAWITLIHPPFSDCTSDDSRWWAFFWHLAVPKWVNGESKWIRRSTMWRNQRLGAKSSHGCCCCVAAASLSSRLLCSVAAVVCRQFSHMTGGWGGTPFLLPPPRVCLFFWGGGGQDGCYGIVASHMNGGVWEGRGKNWKKTTTHTPNNILKYVLYLGDTQLLKHMLHPDGTVSATQTSFHITCICCVSSAEGLNGH